MLALPSSIFQNYWLAFKVSIYVFMCWTLGNFFRCVFQFIHSLFRSVRSTVFILLLESCLLFSFSYWKLFLLLLFSRLHFIPSDMYFILYVQNFQVLYIVYIVLHFLVLHFSFLVIYLLERWREGREREYLPPAGSLTKYLKQLGLNQVEAGCQNSIQVSFVNGRNLSAWTITFCSPDTSAGNWLGSTDTKPGNPMLDVM